jgi:mannosyltransferase
MNARTLLWIAGVTGVAFAILGLRRPLLLDEFHTLYLSTHSYAQMVEWLKPDAGVPMFHFLLGTWISVFGTSEAAIHGLTSLLYLLSAAGVYWLARAASLEPTGAAMASFLYVLSPQAFRHAHYGRPYALLALLVTLSTLCFYRVFREQKISRGWMLFYVLVNVAGTFTHYWFAFLLAGQAVVGVLLWRQRVVLLVSLLAASSLPFVVLWVPVILNQQMDNGAMKWLARPGFKELAETFLGYFGKDWTGLPAYLVLAGAAAWKWQSAAWQEWRRNPAVLGIAILMTLVLLIPFLLSQKKPIFLPGRHTAAALPLFIVLAAAWLWRLAAPVAQRLALAALWLAAVGGYTVYASRPALEDNRPAAVYLKDHLAPGDFVVFTGMSRLGVQYYWDRLPGAYPIPAEVFPSEMQMHRSWIDSQALLEQERPRMDREILALAERLPREVAPGKSVWIFRGYDPALTALLEREIASRGFVLREQVPFAGSHFTHLWRYQREP